MKVHLVTNLAQIRHTVARQPLFLLTIILIFN